MYDWYQVLVLFYTIFTQKPVKWRIKVWVYSDAVNDYIYTFSIYYRTNSNDHSHAKGLAFGVIFKPLEHCLDKGYTWTTIIQVQNYFKTF